MINWMLYDTSNPPEERRYYLISDGENVDVAYYNDGLIFVPDRSNIDGENAVEYYAIINLPNQIVDTPAIQKAEYEINEYVGLTWQPTSEIEFYVRDIRLISEQKRDRQWFEYEIVRRVVDTKMIYTTGWHSGDKLFKVDQRKG
ncbi:hypothetical protein EBB07_28500 [Paenibacillaceae bacterium]|nr:hypothetical protein EBB07_28500 [Paenibacillaceae bacterium]